MDITTIAGPLSFFCTAVLGKGIDGDLTRLESGRPHGRGTGMNHWLGVVCRDHVHRGTERGIAQLGHGKRDGLARLTAGDGLARLTAGDGLVYYSAKTSLRDGAPLQAFTALGVVADDEIWQAHEGDFHPWRRRIDYLPGVTETPIRSLSLDLTAQPGWGIQLRRGLVPLTAADFDRIRTAMLAPA